MYFNDKDLFAGFNISYRILYNVGHTYSLYMCVEILLFCFGNIFYCMVFLLQIWISIWYSIKCWQFIEMIHKTNNLKMYCKKKTYSIFHFAKYLELMFIIYLQFHNVFCFVNILFTIAL